MLSQNQYRRQVIELQNLYSSVRIRPAPPLCTSVCMTCGSDFPIRRSELKRGRGKYCGDACRPLGVKQSAAGKRARALWIQRHGGKQPRCRICRRRADIHHIDGNPLNNDPANHDTLCRSHHVALENSIKPKRRKAA